MRRWLLLLALPLLAALPAAGQVCSAGTVTLFSEKGSTLTAAEVDANFGEVESMCSALSGLDAAVITGTPGANGTCAVWNTDGDLVSAVCAVDTDTTCNDAGVNCLFAASATEGGAAATGDSATSFFAAGTLEHERGGLEVDASAFGGLVRIAAGSTSAVSTLTALNTALSSSVADGAHTTNTNAATICAGSLTYLDGEGGCDTYTLSGSTTTLGTTSGATTSGDCVEFDASGNLVAAGAACGSGGGSLTTDSVGTDELDDDANTPTAGDIVVVETGAASFDYLAPNAGTDVTADLEEETHATEHETGGADAITALAGETITSGTVADARIAATIARDSELHAEDHATRHSLGGGDPVTATNLASGCTDVQVLGGTTAGTGVECQADNTGTDDQVGAEVALTDAGTFFTTDNVEAALQQVGPTMTDARAPIDDSVDADALTDGDLGDVSVSGGVVTVEGTQGGTAFPGTPAVGDVFAVTDDSAVGACDSAAGSALTLCRWDGSAWVALGDGGGAGGAATEVDADSDGNPELYCSAGTCFVDYNDDGTADLQFEDETASDPSIFFGPAAWGRIGFEARNDNNLRIHLNNTYTIGLANSVMLSATARSWSMSNAAGSASVPTYGFFGDENTGTYSPSADTMAVVTGGVARQTWTSTGATITDVLTITPRASAPATCAIGDVYVDTDGAACFCTATNTWSNAVATGSCT